MQGSHYKRGGQHRSDRCCSSCGVLRPLQVLGVPADAASSVRKAVQAIIDWLEEASSEEESEEEESDE